MRLTMHIVNTTEATVMILDKAVSINNFRDKIPNEKPSNKNKMLFSPHGPNPKASRRNPRKTLKIKIEDKSHDRAIKTNPTSDISGPIPKILKTSGRLDWIITDNPNIARIIIFLIWK